MIELVWHGEQLELLPERTVFWPRERTLVLADPHFGKAAAFRAAGIPVPAGTTVENLQRLDSALAKTGAEHVLVLGDFFHAKTGRAPQTLEQLQRWRAARASLHITLVLGNHDRHSGRPPAAWRIECVDRLRTEPFTFTHEPPARAAAPTMSGHVHPSVTLTDRANARLRAPCFWFGRRVALLPAFGAFTGTYSVRRSGARVFAVGTDAIVDVSA